MNTRKGMWYNMRAKRKTAMAAKKNLAPTCADITSEQLMLSPEKDGIDGIPAISHGLYTTNW